MKLKTTAIILSFTLALVFSPISAYAGNGGTHGALAAGDPLVAQSTATAQPMNLNPKYSAFLTNGKKGSAYKMYRSYPFTGSPVIYKARISGSKLILSGTYRATNSTSSKPAKIYKVKNKSLKLTKKTKYYQHVGNNTFYLKSSKAKMKKLLSGKTASSGGDISFSVKKGKVTLLIAQ